MHRRHLVLGLSLTAALACAPLSAAQAQDTYPDKPIHLIVPFPPGGTTDIVARLFAEKLGRELNGAIIVENRGGAGGSIGSTVVAQATSNSTAVMAARRRSGHQGRARRIMVPSLPAGHAGDRLFWRKSAFFAAHLPG